MMKLKLTKSLTFLYFFYISFIFIVESQANSLFLIENIEVTLNIDQTGEVRNKAITLAESDALTKLAKKILITEFAISVL